MSAKDSEVKKMIRCRLLIVVLAGLLLVSEASAGGWFYHGNHRGWFNFEERVQLEEAVSETEISASEELKALQAEFDERKAQMVLHPSVRNVRGYLEYQNVMFRLANELNVAWKTALLADPELDIVKNISASDTALKIRDVEEKKMQEAVIMGMGHKFKLLFFYKTHCQYCQHFSKVLAAFAMKYKFRVASVTLDGGQIEGFPGVQDTGLVQKFGITTAPTLMIFSEELGIAAPVAHGFIAFDELEKNMVFVATQLRGNI